MNGAESEMECVGTKESMDTAIAIVRPGSEQLNLGRIDVIVSNAGYGLFGAAEELNDEWAMNDRKALKVVIKV